MSRVSQLACSSCGATFDNQGALSQHITSFHVEFQVQGFSLGPGLAHPPSFSSSSYPQGFTPPQDHSSYLPSSRPSPSHATGASSSYPQSFTPPQDHSSYLPSSRPSPSHGATGAYNGPSSFTSGTLGPSSSSLHQGQTWAGQGYFSTPAHGHQGQGWTGPGVILPSTQDHQGQAWAGQGYFPGVIPPSAQDHQGQGWAGQGGFPSPLSNQGSLGLQEGLGLESTYSSTSASSSSRARKYYHLWLF
jgi:hypothetical protein